MTGLSDSDRDKLRRERERVEGRRRAEAYVRERFGPRRVTGPDGVEVRLEVLAIGGAQFQALKELAPEPWYLQPQHYFGLADTRRAFFGPGFELTIAAPGLPARYRRHRVTDEDTAAVLLAEAAQAVRTGGIGMLRWWAAHQPRR